MVLEWAIDDLYQISERSIKKEEVAAWPRETLPMLTEAAEKAKNLVILLKNIFSSFVAPAAAAVEFSATEPEFAREDTCVVPEDCG